MKPKTIQSGQFFVANFDPATSSIQFGSVTAEASLLGSRIPYKVTCWGYFHWCLQDIILAYVVPKVCLNSESLHHISSDARFHGVLLVYAFPKLEDLSLSAVSPAYAVLYSPSISIWNLENWHSLQRAEPLKMDSIKYGVLPYLLHILRS